MEYLVRQKNDDNNSWVPESHFNATEIISEFYNKGNVKQITKTRGRPKKNL